MTIPDKDIILCLKVAKVIALQSTAIRAQVGCVIYCKKSRNIISMGYNGMPMGMSNVCEENNRTKAEVIHAEVNALKKLSFFKKFGKTLFVTHAPCLNCAKELKKSFISSVYYLYPYGDGRGLEFLREHNIEVKRVLW
jgi:dCMP deaminase